MAETAYSRIHDVTHTMAIELSERGWSHLQTGIDPQDMVAQQALFEAMDARFTGANAHPMEKSSLVPRPNAPTHATSDKQMDFHTDNAYLPKPCGIVALFCVAPAKKGGQNQLLDGLTVVQSLPAEVQRELQVSQWQWRDPATTPMQLSPELPILYTRPDGAEAIRWWHKGVAGSCGALAVLDTVKRSIDAASDQAITVSLKPGGVLVTDNTQVLHNRSAFKGPRHLERVRFWR